MEFKRKKKRGQHGKVRRTFLSEDGYRIVWRKEVCGIRVPPRFQATVRTLIPYNGREPQQVWDFVNRARPLIKTMKAAQEECAKHKRLWTKACGASGVRELRELFGKIPNGMPLWATKKANRKVYGLCLDNRPAKHREDDECSDPNDQPETSATSPTSSTGSGEPKGGPASSAADEDGCTILETQLNAPTAEAVEREPKRPSSKRTKKRSPNTAKRKTASSASGKSAKKRSRSSPKKRSRSSGS